MSNVSIAGWPTYDMFLIMPLSGRPVHDLNSLRPNPNSQKPVSGSCRVCVLGQTLTPLINTTYESVIKACFSEAPLLLVPTNVTKFPSWGENAWKFTVDGDEEKKENEHSGERVGGGWIN